MARGTWIRDEWNGVTLLASFFLVVGLGLAGYGAYLHFVIAGQVRAGRCDGCAPAHPLFVITPILLGAVLAIVSGSILYRRYGRRLSLP